MTKTFEFIFDIAGPNGYLVHRVLPDFCARTGAEAVYVPVLLGGLMKATGNRPPWMVYADVPAKVAYDQLEFERFIKKHKLTKFKMNPHFPPNSLTAVRVITGAARLGIQPAVIETLLTAMWEEEKNLSDRDVLAQVLDAAGHDSAVLLALADSADVKAEVVATTERAVARGAFGIPTFFVGDEMFFGKERLPQVADALAQRG
jgi:2-hydroxychromene-2-carboxylate isomerase